jgi:hypothetical protein
MPRDIVAEASRAPIVKGRTGPEVAGRLIVQGHQKNKALSRAISAYERCRTS